MHKQKREFSDANFWDRKPCWHFDFCWTTLMRRQRGKSNRHWPLTSNDTQWVYPQWCTAINVAAFSTFALMKTEAFSQNVSKAFRSQSWYETPLLHLCRSPSRSNHFDMRHGLRRHKSQIKLKRIISVWSIDQWKFNLVSTFRVQLHHVHSWPARRRGASGQKRLLKCQQDYSETWDIVLKGTFAYQECGSWHCRNKACSLLHY